MNSWQSFYLVLPYIFSFSISFAVGLLTWRYRQIRGARAFSFLAWVQTLWTGAYIFQLLVNTLTLKLILNDFQMLAAILAPLFYLHFALEFTYRQPKKFRLGWLLLALPAAISLILLVTDPWLHLFRVDSWLVSGTPFNRLAFSEAGGFWFFTLYTYSYLIAATLVLLIDLVSSSRIYRLQVGAILIGVSFSWVGSIPAMLHIIPIQLHDLTPLLFIVTNGAVVIGLFRFRLFSIVPIARNLVLRKISDGVIVVDQQLQIIDLNPPAAQFLGKMEKDLLGHVLPQKLHFLSRFLIPTSEPNTLPTQVFHDQDDRYYDLTIRPLRTLTDQYSGWTILIHEVTDLKRAEFMERKSRNQAEIQWQIAFTLSQSLEIDRLKDQLIDMTQMIVPCDAIFHFELHRGQISLRKVAGKNGYGSKEFTRKTFSLNQDTSLQQKLLSENPDLINLSDHEVFRTHYQIPLHNGDSLILPIFYQHEIFAFLLLIKNQLGYFDEDHITGLRTFAVQAALALQNARLFQQTQELSIHDPLTNLYNRRFFFKSVQDQLNEKSPLSIIMIDIDHFKEKNDQFGHLAGDQVLFAVANTISQHIRANDLVARYGGEEFVLFLPNISQEISLQRAEEIRQAVEDLVVEVNGLEIRVTISMGISWLAPGEDTSLDRLLGQADKALFKAKEKTRNCVCLFDQDN